MIESRSIPPVWPNHTHSASRSPVLSRVQLSHLVTNRRDQTHLALQDILPMQVLTACRQSVLYRREVETVEAHSTGDRWGNRLVGMAF